jgi:hypothetical protein
MSCNSPTHSLSIWERTGARGCALLADFLHTLLPIADTLGRLVVAPFLDGSAVVEARGAGGRCVPAFCQSSRGYEEETP